MTYFTTFLSNSLNSLTTWINNSTPQEYPNESKKSDVNQQESLQHPIKEPISEAPPAKAPKSFLSYMSGLLQWRKNTQEANYENSIPTSQAPSGPTSSSAKNIPQAPLKTVSPKTVSPKNSVTWGPNEEIFFYKQSPPNAVSAKSKLNTSMSSPPSGPASSSEKDASQPHLGPVSPPENPVIISSTPAITVTTKIVPEVEQKALEAAKKAREVRLAGAKSKKANIEPQQELPQGTSSPFKDLLVIANQSLSTVTDQASKIVSNAINAINTTTDENGKKNSQTTPTGQSNQINVSRTSIANRIAALNAKKAGTLPPGGRGR